LSKSMKVLKIAVPAVGEMLLYMLVWVVDTAFVGNWGGNVAVSAVGLSSEVLYTVSNIFVAMGIGVGITTMVAQSIGAGEREKAEKFMGQGLIIGAIVSIITAASIGLYAEPILKLVGANGEVLYSAVEFTRIASIGILFSMLTNIMNAGLRGTGNTVTPLMISVIVNVVTITLDWILIFGRFGIEPLGIMGSAIATSIAYFTGFVILVIYYKKYSDFKIRFAYIKRINKPKMKSIVNLAVPSGLQESAFSIGRLVTVALIMYLGTVEFAANQITTTIESISFMPGWGFAVAATTLVGQSVGAKDFKQAREYAFISVGYGIGLMFLGSILFLTIPEFLMSLFIKEPETIELGKRCLMVAAIEQPFLAIAMIFGGALRGYGDTKTPFAVSMVSNWIIRVPLIYVVIFILKLNIVYVWGVLVIQWAFEGLLLLYIFNRKSKKWGD
jgi:multidrug resistance protein, MATE family